MEIRNFLVAGAALILCTLLFACNASREEVVSDKSDYQTLPQYNYYQRPSYPPQQPYPAQPPQYQANPYYQTQTTAGSRFYANPYDIPPSQYYPQYDADQYYAPPTQYQNVEKPIEFTNRGSRPF